MALGGLSAVLLSGHASISIGHVLSKVDFCSVFLAVVTTIIVLVLAYLTNPSETSFRTYLTELSFKQHLSRLDDGNQDDSVSPDNSGVHFTLSRRSVPSTQKSGAKIDPTSPFHFVSRASVSLRTPKHVFYSFGVLTIAAVYPTGRSTPQGNGHAIPCENLGSLVSDAWYIGAFGRWWRGGIIQSWWHEILANTKDAERCGSGILDVKALDILEGLDGLPFPTSSRLPSDAASKHASTERSAHRSTNIHHRSSTPPPLPKSASLPLHAPRVSVSTPPKVTATQSLRHAPPSPAQITATAPLEQPRPSVPPVAYSPSSPSVWDSSPIIAEVLRQISQSKVTVQELRMQLADFHSSASESHTAIQLELETQRERKREEDAARADLKSRTKMLEDSKRSADGSKRDAEKRLRAAENARDNAAARIERLGEEIGKLRNRMRDDEDAVVDYKEEGDVKEQETQQTLERKKKEIKVAEHVIAALNLRAKELEERIAQEEERLRRAKEEAEIKKHDRSIYPLSVGAAVSEENVSLPAWSSHANQTSVPESTHDSLTRRNLEAIELQEIFPQPIRPPKKQGSASSCSGNGDNKDDSSSPRPAHLSLAGISNIREFANRVLPEPDPNGQVVLHPRGFSLFNGDIPSTVSSQTTSTRFSPFADSDEMVQDASPPPAEASTLSNSLSPTSTLYIPSSLIQSLDGANGLDSGSRSFQSKDDAVLSRDWRKTAPFPRPLPVENPGTGLYTTSPSSLTCPTFDGVDKEDPFEVRPPPAHRRFTSDLMDLQRAKPPSSRPTLDPPLPIGHPGVMEESETLDKAGMEHAHRRWSSQHDGGKERKGLNPEAKAFSLNKRSFPALFSSAQLPTPFDARMYSNTDTNGGLTSLASSTIATHSSLSLPSSLAHQEQDGHSFFSSLSMRAFAPSRAEREVLQRALGGSSNTSLERLPTLSEVSSVPALPSMPSPPEPVHAHTHVAPAMGLLGGGANKDVGMAAGGRTLLGPSLAWLQSLPRVRKPKFSPWEDEEPKGLEAGGRGL